LSHTKPPWWGSLPRCATPMRQEISHLPRPPPNTQTMDLNGEFPHNFPSKADALEKMNQVVHSSVITYGNNNENCGHTINSYNNQYNQCNISISDEKRHVLEWLSPFASRQRHQAVRDSRVDKVGDWLLCNKSFSTWRTSEDRAAKPVLFCYGHPGAGKTYIRYEFP